MTRSPINAHPDACGLYRGAPAVAFTLHAAGRPACATALAILDSHITTLTRRRLERAHQRIEYGRLPALAEFDLISGLTGIGVYLLHRYRGGDLLQEVLSYLVRLAEPLKSGGEELPGYWTRWPAVAELAGRPRQPGLGLRHHRYLGLSIPTCGSMRRSVVLTHEAHIVGVWPSRSLSGLYRVAAATSCAEIRVRQAICREWCCRVSLARRATCGWWRGQ